MGTQQILMIVLSVVIVGVAVGVGITMFQNQAKTSNRQALLGDLRNFSSNAIAFYKIPASMGGGGNGKPGFVGSSGTELGRYLGFPSTGILENDNGTYTLGTPTATQVTITGVGTEVSQDGTHKVEAGVIITANPTTGAIKDSIYTTY